MREDTEAFLARATEAVAVAAVLLSDHAAVAAGRAYYAMLYTAQALLAERGFQFKSHRGAHNLFARHFAQTGALDPKFHRWMTRAFRLRLEGDYAPTPDITREQAAEVVAQAREFLESARRFLGVTDDQE